MFGPQVKVDMETTAALKRLNLEFRLQGLRDWDSRK